MYNYFKNCENISSLLLDIDRTSNVMSFVLYFVSNHAYTRFFTPAHTPLPSLQMTSQLCRRSHQSVLQKYIYFLRTNIQSLLLKYISFLKTNINGYYRNIFPFSGKIFNRYYGNMFPFSGQMLNRYYRSIFSFSGQMLNRYTEYVSFLERNSQLVLQK